MKIGVFHIPNTLNLGSMMMAENFIWHTWLLSGKKSSFVIPTPKPEETEARFSAAFGEKVPIDAVLDTPRRGTWRKILKGTLSLKEIQTLLPPELLDCDAFVVLGGDDFTESYSPIGALMELYKFSLLKTKLKKKVFLLGQTIGPFTRWRHPIAIHLLRKLDLITCRDPLSYEYLQKSGLRNIALCADLAFLPLAKEGKENQLEKTACVFAPSRLLYRYMPYVTYEEYIDFWCSLLEKIDRSLGYRSILLPHAMNWALDDDRLIVKDIAIALKKKRKSLNTIEVIENLLLPWETRQQIFARVCLTITARMHAAISTLSKGGLPLNIAYSEKSHGVIGQHFSLRNSVIDVRKFSSRRGLEENVDSAIHFLVEHRESLMQQVAEKMPSVRQLAQRNIELFLDKLRD
jgi:colanic acid/amylovoran biosynthesis protein